MSPNIENMPMRRPEPTQRRKLTLRKETIKNLTANGMPKNAAEDYPGDTASQCSECCYPDDSDACHI